MQLFHWGSLWTCRNYYGLSHPWHCHELDHQPTSCWKDNIDPNTLSRMGTNLIATYCFPSTHSNRIQRRIFNLRKSNPCLWVFRWKKTREWVPCSNWRQQTPRTIRIRWLIFNWRLTKLSAPSYYWHSIHSFEHWIKLTITVIWKLIIQSITIIWQSII